MIAGLLDNLFGLRIFAEQDGWAGVVYQSVGWVAGLVGLILFLPTAAVSVRRLHDTDHSGWWWWLQLLNPLCFIGTIILVFAFYIQPSQPADNSYGPPPA